MVPALAVAGTAWLGSFSTFNITVQMRTAFWVQARVLALYQTLVFGGMALGAWAWGELADCTSLEAAYLLAGGMLLASLALHWRLPLHAGEAPDLQPAPAARSRCRRSRPRSRRGRSWSRSSTRSAPADAPAFVAAMDEVGHLRRRNGALRWRLFQDVADGDPLDRDLRARRLDRAPAPARAG